MEASQQGEGPEPREGLNQCRDPSVSMRPGCRVKADTIIAENPAHPRVTSVLHPLAWSGTSFHPPGSNSVINCLDLKPQL